MILLMGCFFLIPWACLGQSVGETAPVVVYGRVIDGTGAEPIEEGAVLIQGDRILAVGLREGIQIPPDCDVVDLQGATILPGFINAHVHNAGSRGLLNEWALAGVTTVRDLGLRYVPGWERQIAPSEHPWLPRVLWAGPIITVPGGYPIYRNSFDSLAVTSPEDARAKTADLLSKGVDVVKIAVTTSARCPTLSFEEIQAIVSTAHEAGFPVTAHVDAVADIRRVVEAGIDEVAHVSVDRLPGDLIAEMVERRVFVVPTLRILEAFAGPQPRYNLAAFHRAGGAIALGNDAGFLSGVEVGMPMGEIHALLDARLSPMDIIVAATSNAARACRIEDEVGTLASGKCADLLIVDGNPLEEIDALDRPLLVLHYGVIINDRRSPSES